MAATSVPTVQIPANAILKLRDDLRIAPQELGQGPCYLLEDPLRAKFYRVGVREFTFVSLLDGKTTLGEALGLAATVLGKEALSEAEALSLGDWLIACQLVDGRNRQPENASRSSVSNLDPITALDWLRKVCRQPFFVKLPLANPDRLLDALLPRCGWLVGPWFFLLWIAVVASGICCAISQHERLLEPSFAMLDPGNWARMLLAWCCLTLWHEMFHALVCKKYGGTVPRAGVAFMMFLPAAFVDVTSSWRFRSKWQRIATSAAGLYAELFVASLALLVWSQTEDGISHRFCYDLTLLASIGTLLFNGNPLLRFDGYYVLSDLFDIPNLAPLSQQYLVYLVRRYVGGFDVVAPALPPRRTTIFKCYTFAAAVWRSVLLSVMCLWMIGSFPYLGALIVALVAFYYFLLPAVRGWIRLVRSGTGTLRTVRQWTLLGAGLSCVFLFLGMWLAGDCTVYAPAVVEYSPLTIVRAAGPGFVRDVPVRNGDRVRAGQLLVRLDNHELRAELADIELASRQSMVQGRIFHQNGEIAKYQIEDTKRQALEKKKSEIKRQVEALEVRAPTAGHLIGRNLESLVGQYVEPGAEIVMIGNEDCKELLVAIVQDDIDVFTPHMGQAVDVRVWGAAKGTFQAKLQKVDPSARLDAPHPSLSSHLGGPMPVKARAVEDSATDRSPWELLRPAFVGKVELSPGQSRDWQSGQLVTVSFRSATQSRWERTLKRLKHWVDEKMDRAGRTTHSRLAAQ